MTNLHPTSAPKRPAVPTAKTVVQRQRLMYIALACVVSIFLLLPIWTVQFPIISDYPNHLASAFVLTHINDAGYHFGQYYVADWDAQPYLVMDLLLVGLQQVTSVDIGGRLLLSLCVLAVPAASWYFLRCVDPRQQKVAACTLVLSHNYLLFQLGLISQQLSLALALVIFGLWSEYTRRPRLGAWYVLTGFATLLYFTHLIGFFVCGFSITIHALYSGGSLRRVLQSSSLFIPGLFFFALHGSRSLGHGEGWGLSYVASLKGIGFFAPVATLISPAADFITILGLLCIIFVAKCENSEFRWNRPWAAVVFYLILLYLVFPSNFGPKGMLADRRVLVFLFPVVLAVAKVGPRRSAWITGIALVVFAIRVVTVERFFLAQQREAARIARSFSAIPRGAHMVAITPFEEQRFQHFWAYGVIERGWVSPCLFTGPGLLPLRTKFQDEKECGYMKLPPAETNWKRVQQDFEYAWLYKMPDVPNVGERVYSDGPVQVLRLRKPPHSEP